MSLNEQDKSELLELSNAAADGRLTDSSLARLEQMLSTEPAREFYVRFMALSAGLVGAAQQSRRVSDMEQDMAAPARPTRSMEFWKRAAVIAAAACLIFSAGILSYHALQPVKAPHVSPAILTDSLDPVWGDGKQAILGEGIDAGTINLKSGFARILFTSGATVSLEGPAEFEIKSGHEGYCHHGKLVARVPDGSDSFSVGSPVLTVSNSGGTFGIELTTSITGIPSAIVHDFQGPVEVTRNMTAPITLQQGDALVVDNNGDRRTDADAQMFAAWDFANPDDPAETRPGQEHHVSRVEAIFNLIQADESRRAALLPYVEDLVDAWRGYRGEPWASDQSVAWARGGIFELSRRSENPSDDEWSLHLAALREARTSTLQRLQEAETALRSELSPVEEAILVNSGWME